MTAETSPLLDALFMLGDRVESYADTGMTHALLYKEHKTAQRNKTLPLPLTGKNARRSIALMGKNIGLQRFCPALLIRCRFCMPFAFLTSKECGKFQSPFPMACIASSSRPKCSGNKRCGWKAVSMIRTWLSLSLRDFQLYLITYRGNCEAMDKR